MQAKEASTVLISHGIKPTLQRIAIMSYILEHRVHPTIEDVYNGLITNFPTLSKTTVYNTLRMFSEHSAAQMITIDEHRVCYDGDTHPHPHSRCPPCISYRISPLLSDCPNSCRKTHPNPAQNGTLHHSHKMSPAYAQAQARPTCDFCSHRDRRSHHAADSHLRSHSPQVL